MTTLADMKALECNMSFSIGYLQGLILSGRPATDSELRQVNHSVLTLLSARDSLFPLLEIAELAQKLVDYKGSDWDVFSHGIFAILKHRLTALERE